MEYALEVRRMRLALATVGKQRVKRFPKEATTESRLPPDNQRHEAYL
jgi:hypothetical protein